MGIFFLIKLLGRKELKYIAIILQLYIAFLVCKLRILRLISTHDSFSNRMERLMELLSEDIRGTNWYDWSGWRVSKI